MSLTLATLRDFSVFESTPGWHDLGHLHVPFDKLASNERTEGRLAGAIRRREPTALIGHSGSGKSSVAAHVLEASADDVAAIVLPVVATAGTTVDSAMHLADYLIAVLSRRARHPDAAVIESRVATSVETLTSMKGGQLAIGVPWLTGGLAREVQRQVQTERTATLVEKTEALAEVLDLISSENLHPVLVFDDTDRWLDSGNAQLVRPFFGECIRWLLELPTGVVVAVHPTYFDEIPRRELLQYVDTRIDIPELHHPDNIRAIFDRRLSMFAGFDGDDLDSVLAPDAIAAVYGVYEQAKSLRRAIQVCHIAVNEALDAGAALLTPEHIDAAAHAG